MMLELAWDRPSGFLTPTATTTVDTSSTVKWTDNATRFTKEEVLMKVSLTKIIEMVTATRFFRMAAGMKAYGQQDKDTDKASISRLMETSKKVIG